MLHFFFSYGSQTATSVDKDMIISLYDTAIPISAIIAIILDISEKTPGDNVDTFDTGVKYDQREERKQRTSAPSDDRDIETATSAALIPIITIIIVISNKQVREREAGVDSNNYDKAMKHHKTAMKKANMVVVGAINCYYGIDYAAVIFDHVILQILIILIQIKFVFYHTKFLWLMSTSISIAMMRMMIIIIYIIMIFFSYFFVVSQINKCNNNNGHNSSNIL